MNSKRGAQSKRKCESHNDDRNIVTLNEPLALHRTFLNLHQSGVLTLGTALFGCCVAGAACVWWHWSSAGPLASASCWSRCSSSGRWLGSSTTASSSWKATSPTAGFFWKRWSTWLRGWVRHTCLLVFGCIFDIQIFPATKDKLLHLSYHFSLFLTVPLLSVVFVAWRRGFPWKFASCCLCRNK